VFTRERRPSVDRPGRMASLPCDLTHRRAGSRAGDYADAVAEIAGRVADSFELIVREREEAFLSPLAVRSHETRGRLRPDEPCLLRTPFQRDRDRIVHSKSFRRLKHKTQVYIDPPDHYRTRLTHTLETTAISRTVARALRLNEDLTEAIGLGHDVGHPPFGHAGEEALDEALRERFGRRFRHNEHSLRVVDVVERDGRGLNLTVEVRDGILRHTGPDEAETLEGRIVRLVDRVAYINHDIDDAIRHGALTAEELPGEEIDLLGPTGARRIDRLVHDLVETSERVGDIRQSPEVSEAMLSLRRFMFERVYLGPEAQAQHQRAREIVREIFDDLATHPEKLPERDGELADRIADHVAGMTDRFALGYLDAL
jgi:dGTPase